MTAIILLLIVLSGADVWAQGAEPRLPPRSETLSPTEGLIRRARALYDAQQYAESAAAWQTIAANEPALSSLAQQESVRGLLGAGDIDAALASIEKLGSGAPAALLLQAADACRAGRDFDRAARLYRQAMDAAGRTPQADTAALHLGATLEQDGEPREALEVYRELQLTFRQAAAFDAADAAARRLSSSLGNPEPLLEADYDAIVDRLVGTAAFRRAVDMQTEWLANFPDSTRREEIEAAVVQNLYSLRANDESRARAAAFLKQFPTADEAHEVYITLFRLDVREGRTADVERRGRAILSGEVEGADTSDKQSAARLLAEYLVSVGQSKKALGVYDELYRITRTRRERIDVLWRMAIASLRAGQRTRATKELEQVLRLKPGSETERAALFWLAYAHDGAGSTATAKRHWAALAAGHPFTYYGARAATRIGAPSRSPALSFPSLTLSDAVVAHPDYQAAAMLSRAGLLPEAAAHARRLNAAFRRDDAVALLAARASEAAGDYRSASTLMSSYFGPYLQQPASGLPDDFWALAYPRAYWAEVSAAAARHNVDPLLMLGLARQESHFDRTARSPVGAVGLFQVMPYTAAELDPSFSNPAALDRLTEAAVSAELAAKLLSSLLALYKGELAPTIASYNADKERVQVWWDEAKGLPEELFIDSIPYQQTRAYVRQVLTNYAMYQRSAQSASLQK